ncbi:MAG: hypothetical protein CMM07_14010 [Rhodopirellula sp.]|nr:hypothetical protein [Rhodopirellula sp.]
MANPLRMILISIVTQLGCVLTPSWVISAELTQVAWEKTLGTPQAESATPRQRKNQVIELLTQSVAGSADAAHLQLRQVDWLGQTSDSWSDPFKSGHSHFRLVGGEFFSDSSEVGLIEADEVIPSASDIVGVQEELDYSFSEPLAVLPLAIPDQRVVTPPKPFKMAEERRAQGSESRPVIIFQPAVPAASRDGGVALQPRVRVLDESEENELSPSLSVSRLPAASSQQSRFNAGSDAGDMLTRMRESRIRAGLLEKSPLGVTRLFDPERERLVERMASRQQSRFGGALRMLAGRLGRGSYDTGVGRERLPFALFEIDPTQPFNNLRLRFDAAYGLDHPYRAEYFWSKPPKGPSVDGSEVVDYQQIRFQFEMGGPRMTVGTEIPLVFVDPETVGNVAGLGDLMLTTKTLMADGEQWQLMQVLRTQMATGSSKSGRGNGHVSMEPGLVARYKYNENLLIHSELKLWFPIGGDPDVSGEILRWGMGAASVFYDTDSFALIPTFEFVAWTVLSGQQYEGTDLVRLDGETILNFYPGLRIVSDTSGDFGLFELGINGGASVSSMHWYRTMMRLELRWSF